jgi:catechol 2,3-dioxygenase-like lactoylglutathione lyase family enzyme
MLGDAALVGFVGSRDLEVADAFYHEVLGLERVEATDFARVYDANGTALRVTRVRDVVPAPYTVLGWSVLDIAATVASLRARGVRCALYPGLEQDDAGIWTAPGGARVAWFSDPDGNTLSVSELPPGRPRAGRQAVPSASCRRAGTTTTGGHGVGDGPWLLDGTEELMTALAEPEWVAEQPEAHLLPHLRRRLEAGGPLELVEARSEPDGAYALDVAGRGERGDLQGARAAVYALVGEVAESATYVRQRVGPPAADFDAGAPGGRVVFEVATGMLAGGNTFASHGEVLLPRLAGAFSG